MRQRIDFLSLSGRVFFFISIFFCLFLFTFFLFTFFFFAAQNAAPVGFALIPFVYWERKKMLFFFPKNSFSAVMLLYLPFFLIKKGYLFKKVSSIEEYRTLPVDFWQRNVWELFFLFNKKRQTSVDF